MATSSDGRKYSRKASEDVARAMHKMKRGKLESGKSHRKVRNPKQAIAIGLSEARKEGAKVPSKKRSQSRPRTTGGSKKSAGARAKSSAKKRRSTRKRSSGKS
jgi:hypothetical protein